MASATELIDYLRRCYEADNRETGVANLFHEKIRHLRFLSGEAYECLPKRVCAPLLLLPVEFEEIAGAVFLRLVAGATHVNYPGHMAGAYSLERYRMVHRAGLSVLPLSYRDWCCNPQSVLRRICESLQVTDPG